LPGRFPSRVRRRPTEPGKRLRGAMRTGKACGQTGVARSCQRQDPGPSGDDRTPLMIPIVPAQQEALADLPEDAPRSLMNKHVRPFPAAGFGLWMRDRCDRSRRSNRSSHGLDLTRCFSVAACCHPK
jgi:hypothetical protein